MLELQCKRSRTALTHLAAAPHPISTAETEEYQEKIKEVEDICNPIIAQMYQTGGGGDEGEADEDVGDHDEL